MLYLNPSNSNLLRVLSFSVDRWRCLCMRVRTHLRSHARAWIFPIVSVYVNLRDPFLSHHTKSFSLLTAALFFYLPAHLDPPKQTPIKAAIALWHGGGGRRGLSLILSRHMRSECFGSSFMTKKRSSVSEQNNRKPTKKRSHVFHLLNYSFLLQNIEQHVSHFLSLLSWIFCMFACLMLRVRLSDKRCS